MTFVKHLQHFRNVTKKIFFKGIFVSTWITFWSTNTHILCKSSYLFKMTPHYVKGVTRRELHVEFYEWCKYKKIMCLFSLGGYIYGSVAILFLTFFPPTYLTLMCHGNINIKLPLKFFNYPNYSNQLWSRMRCYN